MSDADPLLPTQPLRDPLPGAPPGPGAPSAYPDAPAPKTLVDAWPQSQPIPLDGPAERRGFGPIWMALGVFVLTFLAFQIAGGLVIGAAVVADHAQAGATEAPDSAALQGALLERPMLLLGSNAVGQWLGFALLTIILARLHTRRWKPFLRLRTPPSVAGLGLAALGWVAIAPLVQWLGKLNALLPLPEWLQKMETMQMEMLEGLLMGANLHPAFLLLTVAVTPAVCEEILFRGYLQRQTERRWGAVTSILLVGIVFGIYHLRLTQALPLATLGVYLGFVVWATGSLWAGVLVHLLNNGFAVLATSYVASRPDLDPAAIEAMPVPWYLALASLAATVLLARLLLSHRQRHCGDAPDARLLSPSLLATPAHERLA